MTGTRPSVVFSRCALFEEALARYKNNQRVIDAFNHFVLHKAQNAMTPFGSKDRPFPGGRLKGFIHAGLTHDVSIIYKISGRNPSVVYLYTIASHDESGTGQPPNLKRQDQLLKRIGNQTF